VSTVALIAGIILAKQETQVVEKRVEVVKEVPKEIERRVEVPAKIPEKYETALAVVDQIRSSSFLKGKEVLAGLKAVRVNVTMADDVAKLVSVSDIRTKFEINLRRSGIPIDENSDYWLNYFVEGFTHESPTLVWSIDTQLHEVVYAFRENGKVAKIVCSVWERGNYGTIGKAVAREELLKQAESDAEAFANDWLAVNPKK